MTTLAMFVTPHGFGHATRAAAVMAAVLAQRPATRFELFTTAPRWVFEDSLRAPVGHHPHPVDVGLVQTTPLTADLAETERRLAALAPFRPEAVQALAAQVQALGCTAVVCDVAALGIAVARAAGLPAVLIENFTWDWIYAGYAAAQPGLTRLGGYLAERYAEAAFHIQCEPVCAPHPASHRVRPVSRAPRTPRAVIRRQLGLPAEAPVVLLTMGGIEPGRYGFMTQLARQKEAFFVIPGGAAAPEQHGQVVLLPHRSSFYHPDLMEACDLVVGKPGYSTLAEAYQAGVPYAFVERPDFREYGVLAAFITAELGGGEITLEDFEAGRWLTRAPGWLAWPRPVRTAPNGAAQIADLLAHWGLV